MALAVAFVACQGAAGLPGEPGEAGQPGAPGEPGETPKLAPVIKTPFASVPLMVGGDAAEPIDVSAHFYDPEGEALTYAIAVDPAEGIVTAALAEGMLTITPVAEGSATITVTATDPDSKSTSASIKVTVAPEGMMAPVTVGTIDAVSLDVGAIVTIQDISQYFSEPEEEMLTYEVDVAPALIVAVNLDGTTLTIRGDAYGKATVTVTATDEDGLPVSQPISVTVEKPAPVVPAPDPVAPVVKKAISGRTLYKDDGPQTIVLADHFSHERAITYEVDSSLSGVVTAVEAEGTLTLTPITPGQNSVVTVTATADSLSVSEDFLVTVMAGSKPASVPTPMPAATGTIPAQTVEAEMTVTVDVATYFAPTTGLTYTVDDKAKATATAAVTNSIVTITGKAVGTATITVTAKNAKGMAIQPIAVTVTPKGPDYKPDMVSIPGVTKTKDIRIDEGQTLQSLALDTVAADPKSGSANVWTLEGKTKGTAMVRIWNKGRTSIDKTMSVTVENTAPEVIEDHRNVVIAASNGLTATSRHAYIKDGKRVDDDATIGLIAAAESGDENRLYHVFRFDFADYFKDADGLGDIDADIGYKASSPETFVEVMLTGKMGVVVDVRKDIEGAATFPLEIYVVDKTGDMSEKVLLSAELPKPIADYYEVSQDQGDGDFGSATVHMRQDVMHTLTFKEYGPDREPGDGTDPKDYDGFHFINVYEAEGLRGYSLQPTADPVTDLNQHTLYEPPSTLPDAEIATAAFWVVDGTAPVAGTSSPPAYLEVMKTGPVVIVSSGTAPAKQSVTFPDPAAPATNIAAGVPTLKFKVTGSGTARVTIIYHRLVGKDGPADTAPTGQPETISPAERKWDSDRETLVMNIR